MFAIIFPTVAAISLGQMLLNGLGYAHAEWLPLIIFFIPALLFAFGVAKRHS